MSKVVKKIGKAVKKVVKGVVKGVKKVWKKVKQSKFLKVVAIAAAVYFGGAALMGGIGGMGAGAGGFMAGAKAGVASAWGGLTGAGTALMSGNIAGAGSSLASGFTGAKAAGLATGANALTPIAVTATKVAPTYAGAAGATGAGSGTISGYSSLGNAAAAGKSAGLNAAAPGAASAAPTGYSSLGNAVAAGQSTGLNAAAPGAVGGSPTVASTVAPSGVPISTATPAYVNPTTGAMGANVAGTTAGSSPGLLSRAWNSLGPYGKAAAVMGGGQMLSGGIAAYQQDKAAREALAAYQANMGSPIVLPVYNPATGRYENPLLTDDGGVG